MPDLLSMALHADKAGTSRSADSCAPMLPTRGLLVYNTLHASNVYSTNIGRPKFRHPIKVYNVKLLDETHWTNGISAELHQY